MSMTSRQRFGSTMAYGQIDRVPLLEEGLRDDVLERWMQQGLGSAAQLEQLFHYDRRERIEVNLGPRPGLGRVPQTEADIAELEKQLDATDLAARLPADWAQRVQRWRTRDHLLELPLHSGLFLTLGVHDWQTAEQALYLLADYPDRSRRIMDAHSRLIAAMADHILRDVEVDLASFSDPIGGNNGPLVGPAMYRRVVLDSYGPIMQALRHRVHTVVFMTYANARPLLADVLAAGFNCLWAMETETSAMDYQDLRRQFGPSLRLIGGIDLDALLLGEDAIRREMLRNVPPLLEQGGYIPLADGRVRTSVPLANYVCYRRLLEQLTGHEVHYEHS